MMLGIMVKMMAPLYMLWFETRGGGLPGKKRERYGRALQMQKKK